MPNYRRLFVPGGTYFFTVNLRDRRQTLLVDRIDDLRAAWRETRARRAFETVAAVMLPDHMHFVWRLPAEDADFPTRIGLIKAGFTRRLPAGVKGNGRKRERNIRQQRFREHAIRDDEDLNRHVDYIHFNPVKYGRTRTIGPGPHGPGGRKRMTGLSRERRKTGIFGHPGEV